MKYLSHLPVDYHLDTFSIMTELDLFCLISVMLKYSISSGGSIRLANFSGENIEDFSISAVDMAHQQRYNRLAIFIKRWLSLYLVY